MFQFETFKIDDCKNKPEPHAKWLISINSGYFHTGMLSTIIANIGKNDNMAFG